MRGATRGIRTSSDPGRAAVKFLRRLGWVALVLVALAAVFHNQVLSALGSYLVSAGPPRKADVALVLAGDYSGNRILTAGELVRQGYAPKALISGPQGFYGYYECDLEIPFAVRAGYPDSYFVHGENRSLSTADEAQAMLPLVRRLEGKRVLLVTSNYHTRRAARIYRAAAPDLTFVVVAAPDVYFTPDGWWHNRQGRKTFVIEWLKTVTEWFGL